MGHSHSDDPSKVRADRWPAGAQVGVLIGPHILGSATVPGQAIGQSWLGGPGVEPLQ